MPPEKLVSFSTVSRGAAQLYFKVRKVNHVTACLKWPSCLSVSYISPNLGVCFPCPLPRPSPQLYIMHKTRSYTAAQSKSPSPKIVMSDTALMSLFNRAATTEQRSISEYNDNSTKGAQEIELDSTTILFNYANGNFNICNRPSCDHMITLDEAL